ncbi:MAG: phosphoribosylformylglycinamidine synthase subunit PurQ [Chlamydiia bacterium]|nr:phosphoribosylformylglycinamidine synthase subunit PurQ [Chlamydiia bacterium]
MKPKALILTGYGINCEKETALACKKAGADATIVHAHYLLEGKVPLDAFGLICFPGGFSFGDELGAGKALASRLFALREALDAFIRRGGCILGICNGFQLLVKLGMLPGGDRQLATLASNSSERFENRWVRHIYSGSSPFLEGITSLDLPVRHGEGRLHLAPHCDLAAASALLYYADAHGKATESYPDNPNGSPRGVAGMTDSTGRILGMMAHPEAALYMMNRPDWTRLDKPAQEAGDGLKIFKNAVNYLRKS